MKADNSTVSTIPLICLPFAGAGASMFNGWQQHSTGLEILPLQMPGREKLFEEPPYRTIEEAVAGLFPEALACLRGRSEVLLFGHSMGAILAFELARKFAAEPGIQVMGLFVSGSPAPLSPRTAKASSLSDSEFVDRVGEFAGYSHPALEDPEMRELLLPTLRADVEMHEAYTPPSKDPIPVPIISIRGQDDQLVSPQDAAEWVTATSESFEMADLPGSHMYLVDHPADLVRLIEETALTSKVTCNS